MVLFGKGFNTSQIAREIGRHRKTVSYMIEKFEATGLTTRKKGSGRQEQFDNTFRQQVLGYFAVNLMKTYTEAIKEKSWTCSESWIRKFLKEHNIRAFFASIKPFLSAKHLLKRKKFADENSNWTKEVWKSDL